MPQRNVLHHHIKSCLIVIHLWIVTRRVESEFICLRLRTVPTLEIYRSFSKFIATFYSCNATALRLNNMDTVIFHRPKQFQSWIFHFLLLFSFVYYSWITQALHRQYVKSFSNTVVLHTDCSVALWHKSSSPHDIKIMLKLCAKMRLLKTVLLQ